MTGNAPYGLTQRHPFMGEPRRRHERRGGHCRAGHRTGSRGSGLLSCTRRPGTRTPASVNQ
ncbi:hypothetical protein KPATCC21470_5683 [Kitasatospora purpeofusca]